MILFNGATGGLGQYMSAALKTAGLDFAILRSRLADTDSLEKELDASSGSQDLTPITFIQMAGLVPVAYCEEHPDEALQTNVIDTLASLSTFLQWSKAHKRKPRILYIGTGHVYDRKDAGHLVSENDPTRPRSVYARTKLAAENGVANLVRQQNAGEYLVARVFGLIAPHQPPNYVLPSLIRRARESNFSRIPGLSYVRDYLDARDVCAHLARLSALEWDSSVGSIINICSGEPVSIQDLLMTVVRAMQIPVDSVLSRLEEVPGRADDVPWILGDPARLTALLGHPPRIIRLEQTIQDALR